MIDESGNGAGFDVAGMTALEEIKKGNHPDRIWATVNGMSTRLPDGARQLVGGWSQDADRTGTVEYVLASTIESLQRENEALKKDRDFWKEQFQVETRYRIELADRGTLLALTDANSRAEAAEAEVARLQAEIYRTERNRDMWKGQVERQAESLSKFREEEISLRETLFKCGSFIADRYQEGDPEYQVVLLVNSAICGKPALASAGGRTPCRVKSQQTRN